jgi:hypothetical protein
VILLSTASANSRSFARSSVMRLCTILRAAGKLEGGDR